MANRGPSLTALLGLLAVAGYQNRDKLSDLARKMQSPDAKPQVGSGLADQVKGFLDSSPIGGALTTALSELVDMFQGKPQEKTATSWVSSGQNEELSSSDLAEVIGEDTLSDLAQKTGLSRVDLLRALDQKLPPAVDAMTPHGRLPSVEEAREYI